MHTLLNAAKDQVLGLVLVDGSGFSDFYERYGFTTADPTSDRLMYWTQRDAAGRTFHDRSTRKLE